MQSYVHGYHERESERLEDQARTLEELLHHDTRYPAGCHVLEAGCGVGAQTVILGKNSPEARFTSVDISVDSLGEARLAAARAGLGNVDFRQADLYALPFGDGTFDHVFLCFVLEHLHRPAEALAELRRVVKPGGTLTVIEGDHGTVCFHPESAAARRNIECLVELQELAGGDALIGRRLYPLLANAGLDSVRVSPRMVYADASRPALVDGFTRKTFIAMVEGVRERAIAAAMMRDEAWDRGIADLQRAADDDGTFCYTFFKGVGSR